MQGYCPAFGFKRSAGSVILNVDMIRFLQGRLRSFGHAFKGIRLMFDAGANMRIHFCAAAAAIAAGFYFKISPVEWCLITLCCVLVIATEGLNTALERLCDRVHPDRHPEIGKAKDLAAGATLIVAMGAAVVGIIIFGGRLLQ